MFFLYVERVENICKIQFACLGQIRACLEDQRVQCVHLQGSYPKPFPQEVQRSMNYNIHMNATIANLLRDAERVRLRVRMTMRIS